MDTTDDLVFIEDDVGGNEEPNAVASSISLNIDPHLENSKPAIGYELFEGMLVVAWGILFRCLGTLFCSTN